MTKIRGYTCSCCGKYHEELPTSYGNPVQSIIMMLHLKSERIGLR